MAKHPNFRHPPNFAPLFNQLSTLASPHYKYGACDKDGRIGAYYQSDKECKGKVMQHFSAEKEDGCGCDKCRQNGNYGPRKYLVYAPVNGLLQGPFRLGPQILPYPVKDKHRIGEGIACNSKECRNNKEGYLRVEDKKYAKDSQYVMECGNGGSHAELELEPPCNIYDYCQHRYDYRNEGVLLQGLPDCRPYLCAAFNHKLVP